MPPILLVLVMLFSLPVMSADADQPVVNVIAEKSRSNLTTETPKDDTSDKNTSSPTPSPVQTPASDLAAKQGNSPSKSDAAVETDRVIALDLAEQRRMANSAEKTVDIAGWQLLLSFIGIIVILQTLRETRRATEAAYIAAESAQDVTRQNRAWVTPFGKKDQWDDLPEGIEYRLTQTLKNTGTTPAINVRTQCFEKLVERDLKNGVPPVFKPHDEWHTVGVLPPDGIYPIWRGFHSDVLAAIRGGARCFLYTVIEYQTIYDTSETRITESVEEMVLDRKGYFTFDYSVASQLDSTRSPVQSFNDRFLISPVGSQQRAT